MKVNSDPDSRAKFVSDPVTFLANEGIQLNAQQQVDLKQMAQVLRGKMANLAQLPAGYDDVINAVDGQDAARQTGDPGPLIV